MITWVIHIYKIKTNCSWT